MTPDEILLHYYKDQPQLLLTVRVHSECVARKALECLQDRWPGADLQFVREAAMLHDIGVIRCNAPGILCHGDLPYICHGVEGRAMLEAAGLPRHALVCERHTGAGLSIGDIVSQNLPLPHRDMLPLTIEEKAICYADKFYSKSGDLTQEKSLAQVMAQMESHGTETLERFRQLHALFGTDGPVT